MRLAPAAGDDDVLSRHGRLPRLARPAAATVLALTIGLAACSRPEQSTGPRFDWQVTPAPPAVGPARIALAVHDRNGRPVTGASLRLEAHMTHPGMRPVLADAAERAPGMYDATFTLTMAGEWVILVKGRLADGTPIDYRFDLGNVEPAR